MPRQPEPLPQRLARLRAEAGLSVDRLARATAGYDGKGISGDTIKKLELTEAGGKPVPPRQPELETFRALAHGLGITADEFPEYRLALAREQLDERKVPLADAIALLEAIEEATQTAAAAESRRAAAPPSTSAAPKRASGRAPKKAQGA